MLYGLAAGIFFIFIVIVSGVVLCFLASSPKKAHQKAWIVVIVKDSEVWIEGYIRDFYRRGSPESPELLLVDLGSIDDTVAIARRFTTYYPGMKMTTSSAILDRGSVLPIIRVVDGCNIDYRDLLEATVSL